MNPESTSEKWWLRALHWLFPSVTTLPTLLDWILQVSEYLFVGCIVVVVSYCGYQFVLGSAVEKAAVKEMLETINTNWKAFVIIAIPLFFRTVRVFLENVENVMGMKRSQAARKINAKSKANPSANAADQRESQ